MMSAVRHIHADELTRLQDRAITEFGGLPGISDPARIEAVLARVKHWAAYEAVEDLHTLTAMYCLAIARGHVFADGNKRTALNAAILFGRRNGVWYCPTPDIVETIIQVDAGNVSLGALTDYFKRLPQKHFVPSQPF